MHADRDAREVVEAILFVEARLRRLNSRTTLRRSETGDNQRVTPSSIFTLAGGLSARCENVSRSTGVSFTIHNGVEIHTRAVAQS